jgi:hypothetical protein
VTRYTPLWLQAGSYPAAGDRRLIAAIWPAAVVSGCAVTVQANMNLNVGVGWVVVPTANNTGSVLCASDSIEVVTLGTAPGAGTNRIDVVACTVTSTDIGTTAGDAFSFTSVAGTPSASPVAPTVPAGSVAIAQVLVLGGQATVQAGNITDRRNPSQPRDTLHAKMGRAAAQAFAAGGGPITFDTVLFDLQGMWSAAAGGFVVPVPGIYLVTGSLQLGVMAGGSYAQMQAIQNASVLYGATLDQVASSAGLGPSVSITMKCAAGDVIKIGVNTSVAVSSLGGTQFCWGGLDYLGTG